ncbi:hypothetical protein CI109_107218 [Kwoniella shandongensis]|uniref:Uncharacterized protein n=1 Tax=Kwoniella shandongensis TaxID=1734106 RepID=A0A5M6C3C1_9TREE|nr:uncharacterized protein CI109_002501 [Kwoniella shandongensis]KAA5529160.1 hypothetical protein CI109_002501 [Kwoniella shandongensis]
MPPHHHHSSRYAGTAANRGKQVNKLELDSLPSMDKLAYYDLPSPSSSTSSEDSVSSAPRNILTNSGNKLNPNARFMRRGKMCAWGPSFEDAKADQLARKRLKICLEQLLPDAAAEVGAQLPQNIVDSEQKRKTRKRKRTVENEFILPHLRSPSPPVSTTKLAPMLALPQSYTDILLSPSMRHTLGDDSMETGLQRTAGELLEGEKPLMQALGKLKDVCRVLERDVPVVDGVEPPALTNGDAVNGHDDLSKENAYRDPNHIPPLPHISDTDNLWRVTQELIGPPGQAQQPMVPPPTITYSATVPGTAAPPSTVTGNPEPVPTPLQRLFTCPSGITLHAVPNPAHPGFAYTPTHALYPQSIKYNLDLSNQCRAVDDALERIAELLADCNEYKERLEEARDRVADVARARKKIWRVVKERAGHELDRGEHKG